MENTTAMFNIEDDCVFLTAGFGCLAFLFGLASGVLLDIVFRKSCRSGIAKHPITTAENWNKNREECESGDVTVTNHDECTKTSPHPQHRNSSSKMRGKTPEVGEHKEISRGESRKRLVPVRRFQ